MALLISVLDWVTFFKVCNIDRGWVEEDMERRQRRKIVDGWKRWGRDEMEIFFSGRGLEGTFSCGIVRRDYDGFHPTAPEMQL